MVNGRHWLYMPRVDLAQVEDLSCVQSTSGTHGGSLYYVVDLIPLLGLPWLKLNGNHPFSEISRSTRIPLHMHVPAHF